jgi:hypothetical protein
MEITYRTEYGILEVHPTGSLEESDFQALTSEIKSIHQSQRALKGILVYTKDFPGYETFSDLLAHGEFVKQHRDKIAKIALCTDSSVGKLLELAGNNLTETKAKQFPYDQKDEAEKWLLA